MSALLAIGAAFVAGLAGAVHCMAMCGAISVTLARASPVQARFVIARQLGRVGAYTLAGAAIAGFGQVLLHVLDSAALRIGLQCLFAASWLWLAARLLRPQMHVRWAARVGQRIWSQLQPWTRHFLPANNLPKAFALGALWGFMPCGLSYAMLLIAATQGTAFGGAAIMASFGLATTFGLSALDLGARHVDHARMQPAVRWGAALMAIALAGVTLWYPIAHHGHAHQQALGWAMTGSDYCTQ